jgi:hypothetical protein
VYLAADKITVVTFSKSTGVMITNEPVVTPNKLTNNFAGLATSGLRSMWPMGHHLGHTDLTVLSTWQQNSPFAHAYNPKVRKTIFEKN